MVTRRTRKAHATIIEHIPGPRGGQTKYRFPITSVRSANNASSRLPQAEDLPRKYRKWVAQRIANVKQEVTPGTRHYGVTRVTKTKKQALAQKPVVYNRRTRR